MPCGQCGLIMSVPPFKLKHGQGKFCSRTCQGRANVHKIHALRTPEWTRAFLERLKKWHQKMRSDPERFCYQWKGESASYQTLHQWIRRHFGRPTKCEECGKDDVNSNYEWANISHQYTRDRTDWKTMCISCHRKYDKRPNRPTSRIKSMAT